MLRRAFSLIEVLVALTMGTIILGVAVDVAATSMRRGSRSRALAELARDASFAARVLEQDIRLGGSGVPQGKHIEQQCGGSSGCEPLFGVGDTSFKSHVLQAEAGAVGVVGDVPRPDGNFPAMGFLTRRPTGHRISLMWHTENNGGCAPTTPATCSTATTSLFFPGETGCNTVGTAKAQDRVCPWGLRRLVADEVFQIVAGDQNWSHTVVERPLEISPPGVGHHTLGLATGSFDSSTPQIVWPNVGPETPPMGLRGAGWVTTLDRVFFFVDGDRLKRVQCRGDVDPGHEQWGRPESFTPPHRARSATTNRCGPAETVARDVASASFSYFETQRSGAVIQRAAPVPAADLPFINRVDFVLELKGTANGEEVRHVTRGSIQLAPRSTR